MAGARSQQKGSKRHEQLKTRSRRLFRMRVGGFAVPHNGIEEEDKDENGDGGGGKKGLSVIARLRSKKARIDSQK
jgi:hypothetical protein